MESNIIESNLLPLKDGSGLIDAEFHKSVGPEHAASVAEQVVSSEEFFAEGTTLLAETTPVPFDAVAEYVKGSFSFRDLAEAIKVDGDRTQLTETQMSAVVDEVIDQQDGYSIPLGFPSLIDQAIVDSKLSAVYQRIESLEETNKKIIAALKHLGLDTNKHFR